MGLAADFELLQLSTKFDVSSFSVVHKEHDC